MCVPVSWSWDPNRCGGENLSHSGSTCHDLPLLSLQFVPIDKGPHDFAPGFSSLFSHAVSFFCDLSFISCAISFKTAIKVLASCTVTVTQILAASS